MVEISLEEKINLLTMVHNRSGNGYPTTVHFCNNFIDINMYPDTGLNSRKRLSVNLRVELNVDPEPVYGVYSDFGNRCIQIGKASVGLAEELLKYGYFTLDAITSFLDAKGCRKDTWCE